MKYFKKIKKGEIELVSKCHHPLVFNSSLVHRQQAGTSKPEFVLMLIFYDGNSAEFQTNKCYDLADEWLMQLDKLVMDFVASNLVTPTAKA